jgi:hypothetical protein
MSRDSARAFEAQLAAAIDPAAGVGILVQHLQRHVTLEARIGGAIDAAHAPFTEPLDDVITAEHGARPEYGGHARSIRGLRIEGAGGEPPAPRPSVALRSWR